MTEQQRADEDAEGHGYRWSQDAETLDGEDVEGHGRSYAQEEGSLDDVAGHGRSKLEDQASEQDVKGHAYKWNQDAEAVDEDQVSDDVGGHQMPRRPL